MELNEYQRLTNLTDLYPGTGSVNNLLVPFLGLMEESGASARLLKKRLREGEGCKEEIIERIGDLLWYIANIATKLEMPLEDVARLNLAKNRDRWGAVELQENPIVYRLYDEDFPQDQQLPRIFRVHFLERTDRDGPKVVMSAEDALGNFLQIGNQLSDDAYIDDGYRYHDVFHFAYAAVLGWSPAVRNLLKRKRKQNPTIDEVEDGARARDIEEGLTALLYQEARKARLFAGITSLDTALLKIAKACTDHLEVRTRTMKDWENAILSGYATFRAMWTHKGGSLTVNLSAREIQWGHIT